MSKLSFDVSKYFNRKPMVEVTYYNKKPPFLTVVNLWLTFALMAACAAILVSYGAQHFPKGW